MKVFKYTVVVKPALFVLAGAIIAGFSGVAFSRRIAVAQPAYVGCLNPQHWKFKARGGTDAQVIASQTDGKTVQGTSALALDSDRGIQVQIDRPAPTADSVYLRNVLDLTDVPKGQKEVTVSLLARASQGGRILLALRQSENLLWSEEIALDKSWQTYRVAADISKVSTLNPVFCLHLGTAAGSIEIKKVRVEL